MKEFRPAQTVRTLYPLADNAVRREDHHFPNVRNSRSPISPKPGLIMPLSFSSLSIPPIHTSVPSAHSSAAFTTPVRAPRILIKMTRSTPHSFRVCMAAAAVPPVAITGSSNIARLAAAVFVFEGPPDDDAGLTKGRLL